jgi:hypothetical protein
MRNLAGIGEVGGRKIVGWNHNWRDRKHIYLNVRRTRGYPRPHGGTRSRTRRRHHAHARLLVACASRCESMRLRVMLRMGTICNGGRDGARWSVKFISNSCLKRVFECSSASHVSTCAKFAQASPSLPAFRSFPPCRSIPAYRLPTARPFPLYVRLTPALTSLPFRPIDWLPPSSALQWLPPRKLHFSSWLLYPLRSIPYALPSYASPAPPRHSLTRLAFSPSPH